MASRDRIVQKEHRQVDVKASRRKTHRRDIDRLIDVRELEICKSDVPHVASPRVCLDPSGVGAVRAGEVVEIHVGHVVGLSGVRSHGSYHCATRLVAVHVFHEDVAAVALHAYAVLL